MFVLCAGISHAEFSTGDTGLISGSKTLLWVTKTNTDGTFNLYARKIGKQFKPVVKSIEGKPQILQAAGNKLHIIYDSGVYQIFEMGAERIDQGQNVPGVQILATCETTDFSGTKGAGIVTLIQMDHIPAEPAEKQPSEGAAGKEDSKGLVKTPAAKTTVAASPTPHRCLYRNFGNQWQLVSAQPLKNTNEQLANPPKIHLAFVKGTLYRLDVWKSAKDKKQSIRLWRLQNLTQWVPVTPKPSGKPKPTFPPHGTPTSILAISDRLVFVVASDTNNEPTTDAAQLKTQLDLHSYNPETNEILAPSTIQRDDKNLTWVAADLPRVTQSGDNIALLWKSGDDEMLAQSDMQGKVLQSENLTEGIGLLPDPEKIQKISEYFLWGIMIILGIAILWPRPRTVPKPFLLPDGIKPGNLLLRLIAFFIDFIPFIWASAFIFFTRDEMMAMGKFKWTLDNFNSPEAMASIASIESFLYCGMVSLGAYLFYCVLMEWRFGWTVGKRLMQLRVLADGGKAPKLREAVLRNVTKAVELSIASPQVFFGILGVIMVLFPILTRYNQRLGDMMARTSVVNAKTVRKITPDIETSDIPPLSNQDVSPEDKPDDDKGNQQ